MKCYCRDIPLPVARLPRQEANFGCARCGCPVITNAHIIPLEKLKLSRPKTWSLFVLLIIEYQMIGD